MEIDSSPRRSSFGNSSSSPEFEFWMVGNNHPELEPSLLTADELFVDGVILPLQLLSFAGPKPSVDPESEPESDQETKTPPPAVPAAPAAHPEASICSSAAPLTSSKRWKDIFKVGEKKKESEEEKEKKKERRASNGGNGTAELNINIWPFSRSRSAGTATAGRPKAAAMRKSSSAPCSRSNSRGENSGGRRWAASPGRPGVHVGRASPVWQVRRAGKGAEAGRPGPREKGLLNRNGGVRGLNLNVNSCIGYRRSHPHLGSCRVEESDGVAAAAAAANNNNNGSGLFRIRALFSKKVY